MRAALIPKPLTIMYWNIQGLNSKWNIMDYFSSFEICILAETFIEEKQIQRANEILPPTHNWIWSTATREKKKGRAMGGLLMGIRKNIKQGREWIIPEKHIIAKENNEPRRIKQRNLYDYRFI